nr:YidC/Oxa1 family membrane protein insertase [Actinomycetes bacterium]
DPLQKRIFGFFPYVFTLLLGGFPAGLVIYWSWNNTLTIIQQLAIQKINSRQRRAK